jgi:hypothetical protein
MYTIHLAPTAITVAADLVEIDPATDKPIVVHGWRIYQTSDTGDAQEEIIPYAWVRGNTTSGSGGNTSVTPATKIKSDAACGAAIETANTTQASAGTGVTVYSDGWNVRAPEKIVLTPEQRFMVTGADLLCLRLGATPADSLTIGCSVDIEELG